MHVCVCLHPCTRTHMHAGMWKSREVLGVCTFLPPCRIRRLSSGSQASMQMPLPTEPLYPLNTPLQQKSLLVVYKEKQTRDALSEFIHVKFYVCVCMYMYVYIHIFTTTNMQIINIQQWKIPTKPSYRWKISTNSYKAKYYW